MEKSKDYVISTKKGIALFKKIQTEDLETYTEKVRALKIIKEIYSPAYWYYMISVIILFLALTLFRVAKNYDLNQVFSLTIPVILFSISIFCLFLGYKMSKIKKILGDDLEELQKRLQNQIKALERVFFQEANLQNKKIIRNIKEILIEGDLPEDMINIYCHNLKKEIKRNIFKGRLYKKEFLCRNVE